MPEWARKKGIVGTYKDMCKNLVGGWSCAKETGSKCLLITFTWMSTGVKEGDPGRFGASGQSQRPPLLWAGRQTAASGFTFFHFILKIWTFQTPISSSSRWRTSTSMRRCSPFKTGSWRRHWKRRDQSWRSSSRTRSRSSTAACPCEGRQTSLSSSTHPITDSLQCSNT